VSSTASRNGSCPYCGSLVAETNDHQRPVRPDLARTKCVSASCAKYSARHRVTGVVFPLQDGTDPDSTPVTASR